MNIRRNTLWRVPVYCVIAGFVSFHLNAYVLARFAIMTLPDGAITIDNARMLIIRGLIFAAAVLLGILFSAA